MMEGNVALLEKLTKGTGLQIQALNDLSETSAMQSLGETHLGKAEMLEGFRLVLQHSLHRCLARCTFRISQEF